MTDAEACKRLSRALAMFADENGVPNGVSPGELCETYSLTPLQVGRVLKTRRSKLDMALKAWGYRITSYDGPHEGYGMRIGIDRA